MYMAGPSTAYSALNINFKGVHMKLKIVALAISVEFSCCESNSKYTWNKHLFSVHARHAHIRPRRSFFAYSALNINFEGVHMMLKSVGLEISVE